MLLSKDQGVSDGRRRSTAAVFDMKADPPALKNASLMFGSAAAVNKISDLRVHVRNFVTRLQ